jgi:hypothetical protein
MAANWQRANGGNTTRLEEPSSSHRWPRPQWNATQPFGSNGLLRAVAPGRPNPNRTRHQNVLTSGLLVEFSWLISARPIEWRLRQGTLAIGSGESTTVLRSVAELRLILSW